MQARVCAGAAVHQVVVGADDATEHLEHRQLADERIGDGLEHVQQRFRRGIGLHLHHVVAGNHRDRSIER